LSFARENVATIRKQVFHLPRLRRSSTFRRIVPHIAANLPTQGHMRRQTERELAAFQASWFSERRRLRGLRCAMILLRRFCDLLSYLSIKVSESEPRRNLTGPVAAMTSDEWIL
jgi:hypothetical protein